MENTPNRIQTLYHERLKSFAKRVENMANDGFRLENPKGPNNRGIFWFNDEMFRNFESFNRGDRNVFDQNELMALSEHLNELAKEDPTKIFTETGLMRKAPERIANNIDIDGDNKIDTQDDYKALNFMILAQRGAVKPDKIAYGLGQGGGANDVNNRVKHGHDRANFITTGGYHIHTDVFDPDSKGGVMTIYDDRGRLIYEHRNDNVVFLQGEDPNDWEGDWKQRAVINNDSTLVLPDGTQIHLKTFDKDMYENGNLGGVYISSGDEVFHTGLYKDAVMDGYNRLDNLDKINTEITKLDMTAAEFDAMYADKSDDRYQSATFLFSKEANEGRGGWGTLREDGRVMDWDGKNPWSAYHMWNENYTDNTDFLTDSQKIAALDLKEVTAFERLKKQGLTPELQTQFLDYRFENNASGEVLNLFVDLLEEGATAEQLDIFDDAVKNGLGLNTGNGTTEVNVADAIRLKVDGLDLATDIFADLTEVYASETEINFKNQSYPKLNVGVHTRYNDQKSKVSRTEDTLTIFGDGSNGVQMNLGADKYDVTENTRLIFEVYREGVPSDNQLGIALIDQTKPQMDHVGISGNIKGTVRTGDYIGPNSNYLISGWKDDLRQITLNKEHTVGARNGYVTVEIDIGEDFDGTLTGIAFLTAIKKDDDRSADTQGRINFQNMRLVERNQEKMDILEDAVSGDNAPLAGDEDATKILGDILLGDFDANVGEAFVEAVEDGVDFGDLESEQVANYLDFLTNYSQAKANLYMDLLSTPLVKNSERDLMEDIFLDSARGDNPLIGDRGAANLIDLFKMKDLVGGQIYVDALNDSKGFENFSYPQVLEFVEYKLAGEDTEADLYYQLVDNFQNGTGVNQKELDFFVDMTKGVNSKFDADGAIKIFDLIINYDNVISEAYIDIIDVGKPKSAEAYVEILKDTNIPDQENKLDFFLDAVTDFNPRLSDDEGVFLAEFLKTNSLEQSELLLDFIAKGFDVIERSADELARLFTLANSGDATDGYADTFIDILEDMPDAIKDKQSNYLDSLDLAFNVGLDESYAEVLDELLDMPYDLDRVLTEQDFQNYRKALDKNVLGDLLNLQDQGATTEALTGFIDLLNANADSEIVQSYTDLILNSTEQEKLDNYLKLFNDGFENKIILDYADLILNGASDEELDNYLKYVYSGPNQDGYADTQLKIINNLPEAIKDSKQNYLDSLDVAFEAGLDESYAKVLEELIDLEYQLDEVLSAEDFENLKKASEAGVLENLLDLRDIGATTEQMADFLDLIDKGVDTEIIDNYTTLIDNNATEKQTNDFMYLVDNGANKDIIQDFTDLILAGAADEQLDKFLELFDNGVDPKALEAYVDLIEANASPEEIQDYLDLLANGTEQDILDIFVDLIETGATEDQIDTFVDLVNDPNADPTLAGLYFKFINQDPASAYRIDLIQRAMANPILQNDDKLQAYFVKEVDVLSDEEAVQAEYILVMAEEEVDPNKTINSNGLYIETLRNVYDKLDTTFGDGGIKEIGGDEDLLGALIKIHNSDIEISSAMTYDDLAEFKVFNENVKVNDLDRENFVTYKLQDIVAANNDDWVNSFKALFDKDIIDDAKRNLLETAFDKAQIHDSKLSSDLRLKNSDMFLGLVDEEKFYGAEAILDILDIANPTTQEYLENVYKASRRGVEDSFIDFLVDKVNKGDTLSRSLDNTEIRQIDTISKSVFASQEEYEKAMLMMLNDISKKLTASYSEMFGDGSYSPAKSAVIDSVIGGELTSKGVINDPSEFTGNKATEFIVFEERVIDTDLKTGKLNPLGATEAYTLEQQLDDFLELFNKSELNDAENWPDTEYTEAYAKTFLDLIKLDTNTPANVANATNNNIINDFIPVLYSAVAEGADQVFLDALVSIAENLDTTIDIDLSPENLRRFTKLMVSGYLEGTMNSGETFDHIQSFVKTAQVDSLVYRQEAFDEIFKRFPAKYTISDLNEQDAKQRIVNKKVEIFEQITNPDSVTVTSKNLPGLVDADNSGSIDITEFNRSGSIEFFEDISDITEVFDTYAIQIEDEAEEKEYLNFLVQNDDTNLLQSKINFDAAKDFTDAQRTISETTIDAVFIEEANVNKEWVDSSVEALGEILEESRPVSRVLKLNDFDYLRTLDQIEERFNFRTNKDLRKNLIKYFDEDGVTAFVNDQLQSLIETDNENMMLGTSYFMRRKSAEFVLDSINSILSQPQESILDLSTDEDIVDRYDDMKFYAKDSLEMDYFHHQDSNYDYERIVFNIVSKQREVLQDREKTLKPETVETINFLDNMVNLQNRNFNDARTRRLATGRSRSSSTVTDPEISYYKAANARNLNDDKLTRFQGYVDDNLDSKLLQAYADFEADGRNDVTNNLATIFDYSIDNDLALRSRTKDLDDDYIELVTNVVSTATTLREDFGGGASKTIKYLDSMAELLLTNADDYVFDLDVQEYIEKLLELYENNAEILTQNEMLTTVSPSPASVRRSLDKESDLFLYFESKDFEFNQEQETEILKFISGAKYKTADKELMKNYINFSLSENSDAMNDIDKLLNYRGETNFRVSTSTDNLNPNVVDLASEIVSVLEGFDASKNRSTKYVEKNLEKALKSLLDKPSGFKGNSDLMAELADDIKDIKALPINILFNIIEDEDLYLSIVTFSNKIIEQAKDYKVG